MATSRDRDMTPSIGAVRRITVGFDRNGLIQQQNNLNPKYPAKIDPTVARVLERDPMVSRKKRAGLGREMIAKAQGIPEAFSVINNFGNAAQSKHELVNELTFAGLSAKQMQADALTTDTGIVVASIVQGHTNAWNRGRETIQNGDQVMWDIPRDIAEAEDNNRAAGNPTAGGYPEQRYTTFLRPYKPELVVDSARSDWRQYLTEGSAVLSSTPDAIYTIRQYIAIGMLLGGTLLPSDLGNTGRASPADFVRIVDGILSGSMDPDIPVPQTMDAQYQGLLDGLISETQRGFLDQYISTLLTPSTSERIVQGKRVPRGISANKRFVNDIQRNGVKRTLSSIDQVFNEAGRDRVIGRALESAPPGDEFGLIMYGK